MLITRCFKLNHQLNHRTTAKANEYTVQMVDFDKNTNTNQNEFTTQFTKLTKTQIYEVNWLKKISHSKIMYITTDYASDKQWLFILIKFVSNRKRLKRSSRTTTKMPLFGSI